MLRRYLFRCKMIFTLAWFQYRYHMVDESNKETIELTFKSTADYLIRNAPFKDDNVPSDASKEGSLLSKK